MALSGGNMRLRTQTPQLNAASSRRTVTFEPEQSTLTLLLTCVHTPFHSCTPRPHAAILPGQRPSYWLRTTIQQTDSLHSIISVGDCYHHGYWRRSLLDPSLLFGLHLVQAAGNERWQLAAGHCVWAKFSIIGQTREEKDVSLWRF